MLLRPLDNPHHTTPSPPKQQQQQKLHLVNKTANQIFWVKHKTRMKVSVLGVY